MSQDQEEVSKSQNISQQLRAEMEETRGDFHALLDEVPEADYGKPSLNPVWTIAEILYHMSVAPRNLRLDVGLIKRFKWIPHPPAGPFNRLNVYMTRRGARNATKESLAEAYDEAHQKAIQALESVKDSEWDNGVDYPDIDPMLSGYVTMETLFHYIKRHFDAHEKDIRLALGMEMESASLEHPHG